MNERDLFMAALQIEDAAERAAYLDRACAGETALRQRVQALLAAFEQAGSFLQQAAGDPRATSDVSHPGPASGSDPAEGPGTVIGPYKLIQQIGEGGMGTVWMAQQTEPVRRLVAVKLIKAGMDSKQVIARFEAERQALALMDHQNIARVLDGGTTSAGRPYFVMDLVKGVPITKYCDEHHLTPRQRLELFIPVCQAVQHAHQKGIIHRDLKPSNVLVALYDGKPMPKVIDFGVAKAAGQPLTDKTLVTGFGNIVGTLEYMSPEQAEINQLDIDTRSDIYSLGVLLYELLTGSPPFSRKELEKAGMLEMLRVIREQEPSKPSTKLSTAEGLPTLAANRGTEPAKLTRLVRGELDWIVMKALEKDRNRRYETANGFALDVQRYLADEAVLACPPSAGYRLRKFVRRNKGGLAVAALVLFFLVLIGSGVGWAVRDRAAREAEAARLQAEREAEAARQQAERQAKVAGQVESIFGELDRLEKEQKWPEALAAARRAGAAVAGGEADAATAERVRQRLKDLEFIDRLEQNRMEDARLTPESADKQEREYARAFRDYGVDVDELPVEGSIERLKARTALALPLAVALDEWVALRRGGNLRDEAGGKRLVAIAHGIDPEPLRDRLRSAPWPPTPESREELRRLAESIDVRAQHPATLYRLAFALQDGVFHILQEEARLRILREAQAVYPGDFWLNYELGRALYDRNANQDLYDRNPRSKQYLDDAIRFWTVAVAVRPSAAAHSVYLLLGRSLRERGDLDETIAVYRQLIEAKPETAGPNWRAIGNILRDQKKPAEAADAYGKAIAVNRQLIEAKPETAGPTWRTIGDILRDQGKPDEAIAAYRQAIEGRPEGAAGWLSSIGDVLRDQGKPDEAIAVYRQAIEAGSKAADSYWHAIGDILRKQKKLDEAIEAYRKASEARPQGVSASSVQAISHQQALGDTLIAQGKSDEAIAVYRQAIAAEQAGAVTNRPSATINLRRALGDTLIAQGKSAEAIAEYGKAIAAYRQSTSIPKGGIDLAETIGAILRTQKKPDEAIALYRQAIEGRPERADVNFHAIGDILREQKKLDEAIEAYRKASEARPQGVSASSVQAISHQQALGDTLIAQGKSDEAIAAYRQAIAAIPERPLQGPDVVDSIVNFLRAQGKPDEAIAVYRMATELKPNVPAYHHRLGLALRDQKKPAEANAAFEKAVELYRQAPNLTPAGRYHSIGVVLRYKGDPDEAIAAFRKALDSAPTNGWLIRDLVNALRARGRPDEVIAVYRKAVAAAPKDFNNHNALGAALDQQGKLDEAIAVYRKAVELAPTSNVAAGVYLSIGNALRLQKKVPEAIAAYYRAVELDPDNLAGAGYINLGIVLREWGKLDEAVAAYRKAIAVNRPEVLLAAHIQLGDVLSQQNKLDEAIAAYRKVIELKSDSPLTHNKLAWILATRPEANLRDPKQAVALARRAVEMKPEEGLFWNTLGAAQYRAGDCKAAIAAFDKSMELRKGGDGNDWFFLAMVRWQLGEKDTAREWFDKGVEWMDKNQPKNEQLRRLRAEAAELLGLNEN